MSVNKGPVFALHDEDPEDGAFEGRGVGADGFERDLKRGGRGRAVGPGGFDGGANAKVGVHFAPWAGLGCRARGGGGLGGGRESEQGMIRLAKALVRMRNIIPGAAGGCFRGGGGPARECGGGPINLGRNVESSDSWRSRRGGRGCVSMGDMSELKVSSPDKGLSFKEKQMNGCTRKHGIMRMWAGMATLAAAGVVALVVIGQGGDTKPARSWRSSQQIVVPPPPPRRRWIRERWTCAGRSR